jgi:mono/diheme cytochrome c family protein
MYRVSLAVTGVVVIGLAALGLHRPVAAQVNRSELKPGIVGVYRDGAGIEIHQLDAALALTLKKGEAPHPRLAADGGSIRWEGYLNVFRPSEYKFSALVRGKFKLTVDGKEVLSAEVNGDAAELKQGQTVKLAAGAYPLTAEFTRLPGDGRLEVYWQAPIFIKEPLPLANLRHWPAKAPKQLAEDRLAERGRFLVEEYGCAQCHKPGADDKLALGLESRQAPNLSRVGERYSAGWIDRWLRNPQAISPDAVMPRLFHGKDGSVELYAAGRYLESLGGPMKDSVKPAKIDDSIKRGMQLFTATGCAACHTSDKGGKSKPQSPLHFVASDFGPVRTFSLADQSVKTTPDKLAAFLQDPHQTDSSGRMPSLALTAKEALDIANYLCFGIGDKVEPIQPPKPSEASATKVFHQLVADEKERDAFGKLGRAERWRTLGERVVVARGCTNCHTLEVGGKKLSSKVAAADFAAIQKPGVSQKGCLSQNEQPGGPVPDFGFSELSQGRNRKWEAVVHFLETGAKGAGSPSPPHAARVALQRFNCLACHTRDGEGGLPEDLIVAMRKYEKAENAESITPPTLSGVGHKLRTPWFHDVLTKGGRSRPWMNLRMPQFGAGHVGKLPEAIAALEGTTPDDGVHTVKLTPETLKVGRQLIGKNNGYGCIACHDIAGVPNSGTRGPDLAHTAQHVRYEWYRRWLESAQRMDPGTKMPSIILDGRTMLDTVLGGNADAQAEAMWAYLSLGPTLPLPEGLQPLKGLTLTVADRPVVLRTFMPEAGSRAVAVGYPGGVSTVFDAAQCRLAYTWTGNFLDVSPVWAGRGGNPAKVLGTKFWTAPPGCPWGLGEKGPPDFAAQAKDPLFGALLPEGQVYQGERILYFEGYKLDNAGQPTFSYRLGADEKKSVKIMEQPLPLRSSAAVGLERHFKVDLQPGPDVWLHLGAAKKVRLLDAKGNEVTLNKTGELPPDHAIVLPQDGDRALVLTVSGGPAALRWRLRAQDGGWQVLLHLPGGQRAQMVFGFRVWSLSRDEPALLKELLTAK